MCLHCTDTLWTNLFQYVYILICLPCTATLNWHRVTLYLPSHNLSFIIIHYLLIISYHLLSIANSSYHCEVYVCAMLCFVYCQMHWDACSALYVCLPLLFYCTMGLRETLFQTYCILVYGETDNKSPDSWILNNVFYALYSSQYSWLCTCTI